MAERDQGQEKTEQATPKRRQDARRKGDVPRSRELSTSGVMLTGAATLIVMGPQLGRSLAEGFAAGFHLERDRLFMTETLARSLAEQAGHALGTLAPLFVLLVVAAIGASVALGGVSFSFAAMKPKLERISPIKGLQRMFGMRALVELTKSVAKVVLILIVAVSWLRLVVPGITDLTAMATPVGLGEAFSVIGWSLMIVSLALIVGALIDVPWQLYDYARKLRMTRQEVRDEHKEVEGRPEVRQRIRQLQQEVASRRMMESVPYADVIITNPTHFAVALRYDDQRMAAPEVLAKGQDLLAGRIREVAAEHRIALFEAPPLARALYHSTRVGEAIPVGLYTAVAQVLAYIYQLRDGRTESELVRPEPAVDEQRYGPSMSRRRMREADD